MTISLRLEARQTAVNLARRCFRTGTRSLTEATESATVMMDAAGRRREDRVAPEATPETARHRNRHCRRHIRPQRRLATRTRRLVVVVAVDCRRGRGRRGRGRRHAVTALTREGSINANYLPRSSRCRWGPSAPLVTRFRWIDAIVVIREGSRIGETVDPHARRSQLQQFEASNRLVAAVQNSFHAAKDPRVLVLRHCPAMTRKRRLRIHDRNARKLDLDYETNFFWYGCYENVPNSKSYVSRKMKRYSTS